MLVSLHVEDAGLGGGGISRRSAVSLLAGVVALLPVDILAPDEFNLTCFKD